MSGIWEIDLLEYGTFSEPRNLKHINTPGRETFPFVSRSNVLYFASSGHQGLGGLDVFFSSINSDGTLGEVINIGKPINTPYDDFSFIVNDATKTGYFSSNRPDGNGNDDLYRCIQLEDLRKPCEVSLTGTLTDKDTGEPVKGATVIVTDTNSIIKLEELETSEDGNYTFKIECDKQYLLRVEKEDCTTDEEFLKTPDE
ncbi:MAG: hypothetical protein ACI9WL_000133 [Rubritalea sp.]|jgi:hypothetical protein